MTANQRLTFIVPGDDPPQLQGSPHLNRLRPYDEVTVHELLNEGAVDNVIAFLEGRPQNVVTP